MAGGSALGLNDQNSASLYICDVPGIVIYAWLVAVLWKANDVLRRQAAQKGDTSAAALVSVSALLALHPPAVLWMLQSRQLWRSFALLTPSSVPTVSLNPVP